jgi:hypothetical protein
MVYRIPGNTGTLAQQAAGTRLPYNWMAKSQSSSPIPQQLSQQPQPSNFTNHGNQDANKNNGS